MEPEGSLPCSEEPAAGPCPEPHETRLHSYNLINICFNIIHHLRLGLPSGLFPSGFPTKNVVPTHLLSFPCVLHGLPISSPLIYLP
jgi:hypothetical protein